MLYLYDKAICDDVYKSFNGDTVEDPFVKVVKPEGAITLAAQLQNDDVKFPVVALTRGDNTEVDTQRYNFVRAKKGIQAGFDPKTNNYYYEKSLPIKLEYQMSVIATNQADIDEIVRELLFKYTDQYFLSFDTPYEVTRRIRFGIQIVPGSAVEYVSRTFEYLSAGTLYEATINLECHGCVLLSYTAQHLKRQEFEVEDARFENK